MRMAGHASFETTRTFYLAVSDDLLERTREATRKSLENISVTHLLREPSATQPTEVFLSEPIDN